MSNGFVLNAKPVGKTQKQKIAKLHKLLMT